MKRKKKLVRKLNKKSINGLAQVNENCLPSLLANKKSVRTLLGFFKKTDLGTKKETRHKERESKKRNNPAGEKL